jgi:hypothetical protein
MSLSEFEKGSPPAEKTHFSVRELPPDPDVGLSPMQKREVVSVACRQLEDIHFG